ncbi:DUF1254 domain-containing protein [Vibrio ouci]|uniref:DUF1254 domain-containing protein n=1 Tax=Vibrio ouci TaxID=2499078 RepID=A0A4Y8WKA8_9VIBR|nr:DUF1254 domain-containing protein [Vibrio ouci]TFH93139.1 DUF1254 domain-containing protein [Vibrio ouci]
MNVKTLALALSTLMTGSVVAQNISEPTVPELHAYKVFHHAEYMKKTAAQAGGTNVLLHTTTLPTEGTDPVVTPALDHLYTKAVVDTTNGPVVLELPEVSSDRYFSIMITDQEHYVTYDEIRPSGRYVFVRHDYQGKIPEGTVIKSRGDYPHVFIRTQVKTPEDLENTLAIQKEIKLTGTVGKLKFDDAIQFTLDTHDIYAQNQGILEQAQGYNVENHKAMFQWAGQWFPKNVKDNTGMFGPIDSTEPRSQDPRVRAAAIVGHLGLPVDHAYYTGIFNQCDGKRLNGDKPYVVTMPYTNNLSEFWSITRYSALTRNTLPNAQDVYNAYNTKPNKDGNIQITFSVENPNDDTYWMPVNAGEPYYYVERFYGPQVGKVITTQDFCE